MRAYDANTLAGTARTPFGTAHHGHGLTPAGVLFAMLRDGTFYEPRTPEAATA
ncbi:hypothetical protein [Streptomyces shenzhenensis]|uniref:hypothetical protein n=1 Tax=Streptomyces shenzhenensis TaxID=943815 RepID=UPI0036B9BEEF